MKVRTENDEVIEWKNKDGLLHREDGPAREWLDGDKSWWLNGKYHREDGPAIECANGDKYWYLNDELHREDGPAIEHVNGSKYWYLNSEQHTEQEFNDFLLKKRLQQIINF
jgi:hypothetical protein